MYTLDRNARELLLKGLEPVESKNDDISNRIESAIAETLPDIPGLETDLSLNERVLIYSKHIEASRATFIAMHGDPFGCEKERQNEAAQTRNENSLDVPLSLMQFA